MRILRSFMCCVFLAGCSRVAVSDLPGGGNLNGGASAFEAAHGSKESLGRQLRNDAKGLRFLYLFKGQSNGGNPYGGLIEVGGSLYGTTFNGGTCDDCGTVFEVNPGTERVLHRQYGRAAVRAA